MKKIIFIFSVLIISKVGFSQQINAKQINPNITPYNDAIENFDGVDYSYLLKQKAWLQFQAKYPNWGAQFNRNTGLPHKAFGTPITFLEGGNDAVAKAKLFIENELIDFQIPTNELVLTRNSNDGKYINVDFKQVHQGKEVLWSNVNVRFTQDLKIALFTIDVYRNIKDLIPNITSQVAKTNAEKIINTPILSSTVETELKLFPLKTNGEFELRPVYTVTVNTQDDAITPGTYNTFVDALNGSVLYRQNKVVNIGFNVNAQLYPVNLFSPLTKLPLRNLQVNVGGTIYYTDANGDVTIPGSGTVNPTLTLQGKYVKVVTGNNGITVPTFVASSVNNLDSLEFPTSSPSATDRQFTGYYHANVVHDYMKTKFPTFTAMDNPMTTKVERTDGNCNAYYNGNSINFYAAAGGCNATSLINDVIYHEYGHGISDKFWAVNGASFDNGAMGEGYSDTWAMCIIKNAFIGKGFYTGAPNSFLRQYDAAPKVYPTDIVGEVHADGEIIAGAWWDVAANLALQMPLSDAVDTMSNIFTKSQNGLATGPDGTEGQVYFNILIDALTYDDVDADITNGTPHFVEIVKAFAKHGIYLLSNTSVVNNTQNLVDATSTVEFNGNITAEYPALLGDVKMIARIKNTTNYDTILLTKTGNNYTANYPNAVTGNVYEYFYELHDIITSDASGTVPFNAGFLVLAVQRNLPYYLIYGFHRTYYESFENALNSNWQIGNVAGDNATGGKWVVGKPNPTFVSSKLVQTGSDHSTGTGNCAVTGNSTSTSATADDVDGGRTSIITESIDISGLVKPVISYWRWYTNSQGANPRKDVWKAYISYNGNTWFPIERTYQQDVSWRQNVYLPATTISNYVILKFIATDSNALGNALVEAAIDDIEVFDIGSFPANVNNVSTVNCSIYPNPADENIFISSDEKGKAKITIINTLGQDVKEKETEFSGTTSINCSTLKTGIYFIKFEINNKITIQKIFIE